MDDSLSQRLVNFLNSRMPRPEEMQAAIRQPMQAVGEAGEAFRGAGHDGIAGALQMLAGRKQMPRRTLPVDGSLIEQPGRGPVVPPHHIGVRW